MALPPAHKRLRHVRQVDGDLRADALRDDLVVDGAVGCRRDRRPDEVGRRDQRRGQRDEFEHGSGVGWREGTRGGRERGGEQPACPGVAARYVRAQPRVPYHLRLQCVAPLAFPRREGEGDGVGGFELVGIGRRGCGGGGGGA